MSNPFLEFLRPHKTVPHTPWTGKFRWDISPLRTAVLFFGLFIFGLGDSLLIQSQIGNAPWSVLAQGIANSLDITMGWSTFGIGEVIYYGVFLVDAFWIFKANDRKRLVDVICKTDVLNEAAMPVQTKGTLNISS
jgi:hypothetical protein